MRSGDVLPDLYVDALGEMQLDEEKEIYYTPWKFTALGSAHFGMLIALPARLGAGLITQPFEDAMRENGFDFRKLYSASIINENDSSLGVGSFIKFSLKGKILDTPYAHFVIDEKGVVQKSLDLELGTPHVILFDCNKKVVLHHAGKSINANTDEIIATINTALKGPACHPV